MNCHWPTANDNEQLRAAPPSADELWYWLARIAFVAQWRRHCRPASSMRPAKGHGRISSRSSSITNKRRIAHSSLRCLGTLGIFVQLVADAAHGKHVMRILRIGFKLLPQPVDVRIYVALIALVF